MLSQVCAQNLTFDGDTKLCDAAFASVLIA